MAIDIMAAFETPPPPLDYVLPNMVAGTVGALVSPGGAGKSMLALQLAAQIAGAPDLVGVGDLPGGHVVYLPAEDPIPAIHQRLHALGGHLDTRQRQAVAQHLHIEPTIGCMPNICDRRWYDYIAARARGTRLLVLDTLRRYHTADENDSGAMAGVLGRFEAIAAATGCSILFLHHSSKSAALNGQGDMQQASRGSSVLVDNIRWQSYIAGMTRAEAETYGVEDDCRGYFVRFGVSKANYGEPTPERWLRRHDGGVLLPAHLIQPIKRSKPATASAEGNSREDW